MSPGPTNPLHAHRGREWNVPDRRSGADRSLTFDPLDRPMTHRLPVASQPATIRCRLPAPQSVVLLALLLTTFVMPVSYRAGGDHAHAHTIFQGLIDAIVGQPHHHGPDDTAADPASPFAPAAIPLSAHADLREDPRSADEPVVTKVDTPEQLGLSMPIVASAAILTLGLLVAALLTLQDGRQIWANGARLLAREVGVEIPPPRQA